MELPGKDTFGALENILDDLKLSAKKSFLVKDGAPIPCCAI